MFFGREQELSELSGRSSSSDEKSVCVVEAKRCEKIGIEVEDAVREKIRRLKLPRDISVRTALVYDGYLDSTIEENNYFDYLIPAERLFEWSGE